MKTHSTASSVKKDRLEEPCPLTVNALLQFLSALQDHQDHQDQQDKTEPQAAQDNQVAMVPQEKLLPHAHHKTLRANLAQLDPQDHQEATAKPDHPDPMDNPVPQDKVEVKDHQDQPDLPEMLDHLDNQAPQDNPELQVRMELAQPRAQVQKARAEDQDQLDHQDQMEDQANQEAKDNQAQPDQTETQEPQAAMDSQVNQEEPVFQDQTQPTALAHHAHLSSCTVNRLDSTAILFLCLFFVEKMKKDYIFKKVQIK